MRKSFLGAFPFSVVALVAIRADDHHSLLAAVGIEGGHPCPPNDGTPLRSLTRWPSREFCSKIHHRQQSFLLKKHTP